MAARPPQGARGSSCPQYWAQGRGRPRPTEVRAHRPCSAGQPPLHQHGKRLPALGKAWLLPGSLALHGRPRPGGDAGWGLLLCPDRLCQQTAPRPSSPQPRPQKEHGAGASSPLVTPRGQQVSGRRPWPGRLSSCAPATMGAPARARCGTVLWSWVSSASGKTPEGAKRTEQPQPTAGPSQQVLPGRGPGHHPQARAQELWGGGRPALGHCSVHGQ